MEMCISDALNVRSEAIYDYGYNGSIDFAKITYRARRVPLVYDRAYIVPIVFCVNSGFIGPRFYATAAIVDFNTGKETLKDDIDNAVECETLEEAREEALKAADFIEEQVNEAGLEPEVVTSSDSSEETQLYINLNCMLEPMSFLVD